MMTGDRFIAVSRPSPAEGVGRALQVAFRDGFELPADMRACLDRLDRITI
ncbi:hypothetical protein GON01_04085 [Sphingomonas sp. MAH-20]|uniref:Uncharacterized protein n=1 Tax=Sphingomonas horti TaxID=2682842 RepID=A0A6I4IYC3_9SPHN|nr:hypothetical protein [Sphingomonas sp. CGMCC 1.13658]MVO77117.1 hypothetical protein [Sphingomonas horti]